MTAERIKQIGARLREMYEFASNEYISQDVTIVDDSYYVDLGQFGEQRTEIELSDKKEFDASSILDLYPIETNEFEAFADELEEVEDDLLTLDGALERMEKEGSGALVAAIRSLVQTFTNVQVNLTGLSVGPLPPRPLPWPGALRPEIDYTAADFPLRYQPPPGFNWASITDISRAVTPETAEAYESATLRNNTTSSGTMILDRRGRVSWMKRADDDLMEGRRWAVWFLERDGIPGGTGDFDTGTRPLAIDMDGNVIEGSFSSAWRTDGDDKRGKERVREIRVEYEQSLLPKNEYGVTYDPRTVELAGEITVPTKDLRVGELVYSYGRVLSVRRLSGSDGYEVATDGSEGDDLYRGGYDVWTIKPLVDREFQPTALSISEAGAPQTAIDYDPLTIPVKTGQSYVKTSELRLGDDVIGTRWGRVVKVNPDLSFEMDRDGALNTCNSSTGDATWSVYEIDVPDRNAIPTALSVTQASVEMAA